MNDINRIDIGFIVSSIEDLERNISNLENRLATVEGGYRREIRPVVKEKHLKVIAKYFDDRCPLCGEINLIADGIKSSECQFDHFHGAKWNKLTETWPICQDCHCKLTHGQLSRTGGVLTSFEFYQQRVKQYFEKHGQLKLFEMGD